MKKAIKNIVPKPVIRLMQNYLYYFQATKKMHYAGYILEAPRKHLLHGMQNDKDNIRDRCIGISAYYTALHYKDCSILDIGANIGDTGAILASYVKNKLILVEASKYFYKLLKKNSTQFSNEVVNVNAFIYDGSSANGSLVHWGGTAYFDPNPQTSNGVKTLTLEDVAETNTKFIKIDADGCDHRIILSSIEFLCRQKPLILYEEMIRDGQDLLEANAVIDAFTTIRYKYFVLWDQDGEYILSTSQPEEVKSRLNALFEVWTSDSPKTIYNYEVLAIPECDFDIYTQIVNHCALDDAPLAR